MSRLSRLTVTLLAATLLLVACGGQPAAEEAPEPTAAPAEATTAPEAEPTESAAEPTTAPAEEAPNDEAAASADGCEAGFRLFEHAMGETCIPEDPQSIVTLQDQNALLPLFELGFTDVIGSVGAERPDGEVFFRRMQDYDTSSVTYVGIYGKPNLEEIVELSPDLIISTSISDEENYDLLVEIAPTILIDVFAQPLPETMAIFADIADKEDALISLQARYEERVQEVAAAREANGFETVSLVIFRDETSFLIEPVGGPTMTLQDIGFTFPPAIQEVIESGERGNFNVELLDEFDADLFVWPYFGQDASADRAPGLRESPLWLTLDVVETGNAHAVDGERWYGLSYGALFNVLDDVEMFVTNPGSANSLD